MPSLPATDRLDAELEAVVQLVAVLTAFVIGFLAAAWSRVVLLNETLTPEPLAEIRSLRSRLVGTRRLLLLVAASAVAVAAVVAPLVADVISLIGFDRDYVPLRAGFLLMVVFVLAAAAAASVAAARLNRRIDLLDKVIAKRGG